MISFAARAATKVALLGLSLVLADGATAQQAVSPSHHDAAAAGLPRAHQSASETIAERRVWKRVTLGQYRGIYTLRAALEAARMRVGDMADEILGRPAFSFSAIRLSVDLVLATPKELGLVRETSLGDIYRRAIELGLELCPAEAGPLVRLAYPEQPVGEFLRIAMKPVATWGGTPVDLTVANGGAGLILIGAESRLDLMLGADTRFVFVRPQRIAGPDVR
jgi:hypothetical protein